jgi:hypothetical protein
MQRIEWVDISDISCFISTALINFADGEVAEGTSYANFEDSDDDRVDKPFATLWKKECRGAGEAIDSRKQ